MQNKEGENMKMINSNVYHYAASVVGENTLKEYLKEVIGEYSIDEVPNHKGDAAYIEEDYKGQDPSDYLNWVGQEGQRLIASVTGWLNGKKHNGKNFEGVDERD